MSIEEHGIFQTQVKAAGEQLGGKDGLRELQKRSVFYLDERIVVYLLGLAAVALCVVWATASSTIVLYGSLGGVIVLTFLWGFARIKRIERLRRERELQAESFGTGKSPPENDG